MSVTHARISFFFCFFLLFFFSVFNIVRCTTSLRNGFFFPFIVNVWKILLLLSPVIPIHSQPFAQFVEAIHGCNIRLQHHGRKKRRGNIARMLLLLMMLRCANIMENAPFKCRRKNSRRRSRYHMLAR